MFCFVQHEASFLVEFVSGVINGMTLADLNLATLKEDQIKIIQSKPFGKSLRLQKGSCENRLKLC